MADPVYLTINEFPGTGAPAPTVVDFAFAGGYIIPAHVKAELFDPVTYLRTPVTVTDEHFVTDYRLSLPVSVPAGSVLRVYRDTPKDQPLVNFTNGARIAENNLDLVAEQAVFVAAESADQIAATQIADVLQAVSASATNAVAAQAAAAASAASAALSEEAAQDGASVAGAFAVAASNSATAAAASAQDAADEATAVRADLASAVAGKGAEMVAFKQTGVGAVDTTVSRRLGELSLSLDGYGAVGDGGADDRLAILAAIDAAYDIGGARITGTAGKIYRYTGRIKLRPGVVIDLGRDQQTSASPTGQIGCYLLAADSTGGIDLVGGSHIRATLRTAQPATYTGPMLDVCDTKSTELGFGRNERAATFDVDIRGNRQVGSIGVRLLSETSNGVSWVKGVATVGEMDFPMLLETSGSGYVNENWLDVISYGSVDGLRGINNGAEISSNRIRATIQTDSLPRAKRALRWDGTDSQIDLKVWDWATGKVDTSGGGTPVELTSKSAGNIVDGFVSRGTGSGGFLRNPVIDYSSRSTGRNIVRVTSGRFRGDLDPFSMGPSNLFQRTFAGDQDDSFAFANLRYTVTTSGSTPPDATSIGRLFDLTGATCNVTSCTDYTVTVDLGAAPGGMIGMGVVFTGTADMPDKVRVQSSPDGATWTTVMEAGYSGDQVPQHLFRDDGIGNIRYWRLQVENTTAKRVQINRWWAADVGFSRLPGAFAPINNPTFYNSVRIASDSGGNGLLVNGTRVVRGQQPAIANASSGTEIATINAILTALRAHGLIAP